MVPSSYQQINLVSYQPGLGHFTDSNLNGWGMTSMPDGAFVVANAFSTGQATFYDRSGHMLPQTITVPVEADESAFLSAALNVDISTVHGHPTGVVYNPTNDFVITNPATGVSAPATLIFDTIDGTISGWNPVVDPTHAILIRDTWAAGTPAIYTGLEIGQDSHGNNVLYAADFLNNHLEVINGSFSTISTTNCAGLGVSSDAYSWVWSVQAANDKLYVTFADLLNPAGGGGGAVDVFDTDGHFQYQLDANGPGSGRLQNPWGITQAPTNFGAFSNDLVVGNVAGAGNINVYNPNTHQWLGQLSQPNGTPIAIKGLWDLEFGDGTPDSGKTNWLYFDAGPNHPGDSTGGLFGVILAAGDQGGNRSVTIAQTVSLARDLFLGQSPLNSNIWETPPQSIRNQSTPTQPTTAEGSTGTALEATIDSVRSTADSNGVFDIPLLGWTQATGQPADFFAALSNITKKISDTGGEITQNLK
jgi:uncharacterized protein (TIGR03118 family)